MSKPSPKIKPLPGRPLLAEDHLSLIFSGLDFKGLVPPLPDDFDSLSFLQQMDVLYNRLEGLDDASERYANDIKTSFEESHAKYNNERTYIRYLRARLSNDDYSQTLPSIAERAARLAEYAKKCDERQLEDYARLLFPEWSFETNHKVAFGGTALPTTAPEKYQGLRGPETPPAFVQRVYGQWLGQGLTRAHIRQLDPTLYQAIVNWTRKPANEWPADVDLPTLKEQNTRWADRVGQQGILSAVEGLSGPEAVREARRLANLRHRRSRE